MPIDLNKLKKKFEQVPTASGKLELVVLDGYVNFMKNKKGKGSIDDIKDFKLSEKDSNALAAQIGTQVRGYFLNNYLMQKGARFNIKDYNKDILDEVTGNYLKINEELLKDAFGKFEDINPETINTITQKHSGEFEKKEKNKVLDPVSEIKNKDTVFKYIHDGFAKKGIKITNPALQYLHAPGDIQMLWGGGDLEGYANSKTGKKYLKYTGKK